MTFTFRGSDSKQGLVSHLNLRKDSGDESKHLGIKNDQSQPINLKRKPTEIKQDIDVSGSVKCVSI